MPYRTDLDGYFRSPHDSPPTWLLSLMLTAYLDESGQDSKDWVFIAGFLGNDEQWQKCATDWKTALGQKSRLHMRELRWNHPRTARLLAKLGPIPRNAGLEPVLGGVRVSHYADLIAGGIEEKLLNGYVAALYPLLIQMLKWIPRNERVEIVFEEQQRYAPFANAMLGSLAALRIPAEVMLTRDGLPKLAGWKFVPKESTILTQPADFLAYATTQVYRDRNSERAKMCMPIVGDEDATVIGKVLSRHEVRSVTQLNQTLIEAERRMVVDLKPKTEEQFEKFAKLVRDTITAAKPKK